jgi:glycosyltransferase involved in cell wall biosynthesis
MGENKKSRLCIIIPCYNEEAVLPVTAPMFLEELHLLIGDGRIAENSRIMFVDDGSRDDTWNIITEMAEREEHVIGIRQSRNRGHQKAVLAGLMEAKDVFDITISIDCDGQDDIRAMGEMVDAYHDGCEIVYGVRSSRDTDTFFKRFTADSFYRFMNALGAEVVFNHADYRLLSARVLQELSNFKEVNIFLRGMVPLVGFKSTSVYYERRERMAGKSHYPVRKMFALAMDGITSMSTKPLHMIMDLGLFIAMVSFAGVIWSILVALMGRSVAGWASMTCIICFIGGVQLVCIGMLGEYIGKIYMEVKHRPRYIISERTGEAVNGETQGEVHGKTENEIYKLA